MEYTASLTTIMQLTIITESICGFVINTLVELYTYYTTITTSYSGSMQLVIWLRIGCFCYNSDILSGFIKGRQFCD